MSITKNFLYNVCYQLLIISIPLITTPYISRVIGPEGLGAYSYTNSVVSYFILFAMLGLNNYGNRSIAAVRDDKFELSKTFFNIYALQFLTSFIMLIIYVIYVSLFVSQHRILYYIQILLIISTIGDINWFFFGLEQFKLTVVRNTFIKVFTLISIFIFVKDRNDLWIYVLILSLGTFMSQLVLWFFMKRYIIWMKPSFNEILRHLKPNLFLFIPILAGSIYKVMDKIMIGNMTDKIQVAYYENSEKIINIPIGIISALGVVMLPRMSNIFITGNKRIAEEYIEKSLKFVMFISIGSTVGLIGIAPIFVPLFLGESFINCISVVSIISITILFVSWANVIRTQYLIPSKKDNIYIKSMLLGAVVNFIINILFITKFGAIGAAIGTVFAEAIVAVYQTFKVRKEINIAKYLVNSCIYIVPAICMYLCIISLRSTTQNIVLDLLIKIITGGTIYIIFSGILLFLFDKNIKVKFVKLSYKIRKS